MYRMRVLAAVVALWAATASAAYAQAAIAGVVEVVMADRRDPAQPTASRPAPGHQFVRAVSDGVAQDHVDQEHRDHRAVNGHRQQEERQEGGLHQRLDGVEGVGRPRRGVQRGVMTAVHGAKQPAPAERDRGEHGRLHLGRQRQDPGFGGRRIPPRCGHV